MGNTLEVQPQPNDAPAYKAMSALCHALYELDRVAIVRYCRTNSTAAVAAAHRSGAVRATHGALGCSWQWDQQAASRPSWACSRPTFAPTTNACCTRPCRLPRTCAFTRTPLLALAQAGRLSHEAHARPPRTACTTPPPQLCVVQKGPADAGAAGRHGRVHQRPGPDDGRPRQRRVWAARSPRLGRIAHVYWVRSPSHALHAAQPTGRGPQAVQHAERDDPPAARSHQGTRHPPQPAGRRPFVGTRSGA